MCIFKKNLKKYLNRYRRPALCGLAAGFLCGLFGSGGGALLLSVLRKQTDEKVRNHRQLMIFPAFCSARL